MPTLLYIGQNPAAGTGSPIIVLRHLQRLAAEGWDVDVLADYGGEYAACRAAGWTVKQLCHRRWWWPPYRDHPAGLRWMRLRLLAREAAARNPAPDVILSYLASHTDFSADLASHVAQITGAPLHILVHDDAAAFPAARGRETELRREHERILRNADTCWFVSPELADCFSIPASRRKILYPLPEGWPQPAVWRERLARRTQVYYAGHLWSEQLPLLGRVADCASEAGAELAVLSRPSAPLRALSEAHRFRLQAPFATNGEALAHLATEASAVIVSYAETVDAMPWSATSFPSKLVEYCHLGVPIAIIAPANSAVGRWAERSRFPYFFEPAQLDRLKEWFAGLRDRRRWEEAAAVSLQLARSEFDPERIQAALSNAFLAGTESRAA
jgi:hypothetical protein